MKKNEKTSAHARFSVQKLIRFQVCAGIFFVAALKSLRALVAKCVTILGNKRGIGVWNGTEWNAMECCPSFTPLAHWKKEKKMKIWIGYGFAYGLDWIGEVCKQFASEKNFYAQLGNRDSMKRNGTERNRINIENSRRKSFQASSRNKMQQQQKQKQKPNRRRDTCVVCTRNEKRSAAYWLRAEAFASPPLPSLPFLSPAYYMYYAPPFPFFNLLCNSIPIVHSIPFRSCTPIHPWKSFYRSNSEPELRFFCSIQFFSFASAEAKVEKRE